MVSGIGMLGEVFTPGGLYIHVLQCCVLCRIADGMAALRGGTIEGPRPTC
jgi:hypothetical protein